MSDPKIRYAIICGSRTGSTHLCDLLESTNRLGTPNEYFNPNIIHEFYNQYKPNDFNDYVNKLYWNTKKDNDCMGVKIISDGWTQMKYADAFGYLDEVTHWINLKREDIVLQAISRYKAWFSNQWQHEGKGDKVHYSEGDINFVLNHIKENNKREELFLKDKNVIEISYEDDLVESPDQTVCAILNFVGLPLEDLPELKSSIKVGDRIENLEWKERFNKKNNE